MKTVEAYEDSEGELHKSKTDWAVAELNHWLASPNNPDAQHNMAHIPFMVKERKKVIRILQEIDAPNEDEEYRAYPEKAGKLES